ncbi:hypothetical protein M6D81_03380 [Paenibacillus sp. J5C_2022]|uniref:hypothetical protein n=1 Tax=Paenibacillus sp. J5C2022 TaxID=2977129 RepID=UPI0021D34658|nr:hypothetical protein [Paenibacillus sp. J5C2022]MCU6707742.1 hypothetical protein [Paenibacillus sp. J5C2022]
MKPSYEVRATFQQNEGKRGERITMKVQYANLNPDTVLDKSIVRIPDYSIFDVMKHEADGTYTWSYTIPWEAPLQTYRIDVYAIDTNGNRGAVETVSFKVTG